MSVCLSYFPKRNLKTIKIEIVEKMHHWHSFIDAVRGEAPLPSANFDYSGPLTETVLLGGIATRFPKQELIWDAPNLSFKDNPKRPLSLKRNIVKDGK